MKQVLILTVLAACGADETISAFGGGDDYVLIELNGTPVATEITLNISDNGQISGQGPCNRYSADQSAPYPWFAIGPIISTRMACPDLPLEADYFSTLESMTIAEVAGPVLILSNDSNEMLVYQSR